MIVQSVLHTLKNVCPYDPKRTLLVGLSGGPDSLTLLNIFHKAGIKLVAAHLDHSLRSESPSDAKKVKEICTELNIDCVVDRVDVNAFALKHKKSKEEAARECRYRFLFDQAQIHSAQAVVVAHTADDQVETILMHLLRGAGMSGLSGMLVFESDPHWSPDISLYRPMLGIWRDEVLAYCENNGLNPVMDESNKDEKYFRNSIRHSLIPVLEHYNPQIRQGLIKMSDVIQEDDRLLNKVAEEIWDVCCKQKSKDCISVHRSSFEAQPLSLKRRMIRLGIKDITPDIRDIGFDSIERALTAIQSTNSGVHRVNLGNGLDLVVESDEFHILEDSRDVPFGDLPQLAQKEPQALIIGETLILDNNWQLSARMVRAEDMKCLSRNLLEDPLQAWMSLDAIELPLIVRGKKVGDRCQPLGLDGHSQKLSDFFINEKVPPGARLKWPLVVSGEEIIWVAGLRLAEKTSLTGEESTILNLTLKKLV